MKRRVHVALAVVAALAAGGCPPPGDVPTQPSSPMDAPAPESPAPTDATPAQPGTDARTPESSPADGPRSARPADGAAPIVYEKLRGGVHVARCPACGEVQPEGATKCRCGQELSPWRHEETCPHCVGDGRCARCGDDRVCLACDGDGKCGSCGGAGTLVGGAACPECAGNRQCGVCRGDGRRDHAAGDFLPTEGWMPGACGTCIDGSGLCPDCGATGLDRGGAACVTCGGGRVCPDCAGEGTCPWCASDGDCPECAGGGMLVRNGAPRGADERMRRIRTAAGSLVTARVTAPPDAQGLRLAVADGARTTATTLPRPQVDALSWTLVARDFAPGWNGRVSADPADIARYRVELALSAMDAALWAPAARELRAALSLDPARAASVRMQISDLEQRRAEAWAKRAEEAQRMGDRERAVPLLEMVVFAARGSALGKRAELQALALRKDLALEQDKLGETERVRRDSDAKAAVERAVLRARTRLDRARRLLTRAASGADDLAADRTFARAEFAAWSARRTVQTAAARHPAAATPWSTSPDGVVTESRLVSASVLETWATRAVAGGRFALGERLARRGTALDPTSETLKGVLAQAAAGRARTGVLQGSPPPSPR